MRHGVVADGKRAETRHGEARRTPVAAYYAAVIAHNSPYIALHLAEHVGRSAVVASDAERAVGTLVGTKAAYLAVHCSPHVAPAVGDERIDQAVVTHDVLHTQRSGVDAVESAVVHACIDAPLAVFGELPHVYALQLLRDMTVGYHDGRRRSKQSLFFYYEHAAHVRADPIASVSVVYDVVSPRRRVAARRVDDNHVAQLSGLWVVDIQPVIGADNHPSVKVCIHTAHAIVRHVVGRRALTEPHKLGCVVGHEATSGAVSNESVGASEPKSAVCAAMYQMKAVALARIGDVAQLSVFEELALS